MKAETDSRSSESPLHYIAPVLLAILSLAIGYAIISLQMGYLRYSLYTRLHLPNLNSLLQQFVISKLAIGLALLFLGTICLLLFRFTFSNTIFISISVLCFIGIAYSYLVIEIETSFHAGMAAARWWFKASSVSGCLLLFASQMIGFRFYFDERSAPMRYAGMAALALCSAMICLLPSTHGRIWLFAFYAALAVCHAYVRVSLLREGRYGELLQMLLPDLAFAYIIVANVLFRREYGDVREYSTATRLYTSTMYAVPALVFAQFLAILNKHQQTFLHGRETNRKIYEINIIKRSLSKLLLLSASPHIGAIKDAAEFMMAAGRGRFSSEEMAKLESIKSEVNSAEWVFQQIDEYSLLQGDTLDTKLSLVELNNILESTVESMCRMAILADPGSASIEPDIGRVSACPISLMQALQDIAISLRQLDKSSEVSMVARRNGCEAIIEYSLRGARISDADAYRIVKRVSDPRQRSLNDLQDLNFAVSVSRHLLERSCGSLEVFHEEGIRIRCSIPISTKPPPEPAWVEMPAPDLPDGSAAPMVLVVSTDAEQREQILRYLAYRGLSLTICDRASSFIACPELLRNYSLIVAGDMFYGLTSTSFCDKVREEYSLSRLPILLVVHNVHAETFFPAGTAANDYLVQPYPPASLANKAMALILMKESADDATRARLRFLQSQINPHFIFNSISAIMQLCISAPLKAYELLGDFSNYLRGHLTNLSLTDLVPIEKEIELVSAYLRIEKARFGEAIRFRIDADCDERFKIMPLLIEPLVENCVKHGLKAGGSILIAVAIRQEGDRLYIAVEDDGPGIESSILEGILENRLEGPSIGLRNVSSRLLYYYGTKPRIESMPGKGTRISFSIEARREP